MQSFNLSSSPFLCLYLHLLLLLKSFPYYCLEEKMMIDTNAENTDPFTGFVNTFRRQKLDSDAIVIQRSNLAATTYHLIDDANGHPIFTRPYSDRGKKFIFFNNPSFPAGSGHYIVLRKMDFQKGMGDATAGINSPAMPNNGQPVSMNPFNEMPQVLYETFTLSFKDSLSGSVTDLDPLQYSAVQRRSSFPTRKKFKSGFDSQFDAHALTRVKRNLGLETERYSFSTVIDLDSVFSIGNFTMQ